MLPALLWRRRLPWRQGHRCRLWVDGEQFLPVMLDAIAAARKAVIVEQYLVESGRLMDRLIAMLAEPVRRGVQVYMLLDDYGSRGLNAEDRRLLRASGVRLAFFNRLHVGKGYFNLIRNHRKLLWIDGERAFVGGFGFTDDYLLDATSAWHDIALEIQGPCLEDWLRSFALIWQRCTGEIPALPQASTETNGARGRLSMNYPGGLGGIRASLLTQIRQAQRRVWMTTAYFAPTRRLRRELCRAARRGTDVRLMLPGPISNHPGVSHAARRFYGKLLRAGVRIMEYQPRFLHAKYLLCDDWLAVGSCNYDHWTLRWNLEGNQEVEDQATAQALAGLFARDCADCIQIQLQDWQARAWQDACRNTSGGRWSRG